MKRDCCETKAKRMEQCHADHCTQLISRKLLLCFSNQLIVSLILLLRSQEFHKLDVIDIVSNGILKWDYHNIFHIHSRVPWDCQHYVEYSSHSVPPDPISKSHSSRPNVSRAKQRWIWVKSGVVSGKLCGVGCG